MSKVKIITDNENEELEQEEQISEKKEETYEDEQEKWIEDLKKKLQGRKAVVLVYRKETPVSPYTIIGREEITDAEQVHDIIERYGFERGGTIKVEIRVGGRFVAFQQKEFEIIKKEQPQQQIQPQPIQQNNFNETLATFLQNLVSQERDKHLQDIERLRKEQEMQIERIKSEQQEREKLLTTLFNSISQQTQAFIQMQQTIQQQMQQKSDEFMKTMIEIFKFQQQPKTDLAEEIAKLKTLGIIPEKQDNTETISKMFELINNSFNLGLSMGMQREHEEKTDIERIIGGITDALKNIIELKKITEPIQQQNTLQQLPITSQSKEQKLISKGENKSMKKEYEHPFEKILDDYRGMIIMMIQGPASAKEIADAIFNQIPDIYFDGFCDYVKNILTYEQIYKIIPELEPYKEKINDVIENLKLNIELLGKLNSEPQKVKEGG